MLAGIAHSIIQSIFLLKDQIFLGISQQNFSASIKEFLGLPFYGNESNQSPILTINFFICYLAPRRLNLSHCRGKNLTNPTLIAVLILV